MTGVDCVSIAVGNVHYMQDELLHFDFERLQEIRRRVAVPLVLHGGAAVSDQDMKKSVALGISKYNIMYKIHKAFLLGMKENLDHLNEEVIPGKYLAAAYPTLRQGLDATLAAYSSKIRLLGGSGRHRAPRGRRNGVCFLKSMLQFQAAMHAETPPLSETPQTHIVSVRSLVAFVLQEGDLTPGGFQKRDRAQAGTQGHKRVQRSRPEGYQTEVEIAFLVEGEEPPMEVRGRIDGLYAAQEPVIIEEIKTTTLALDLVSEEHNPLHWAQAQCYAYMLARQENLSEVRIHLTYYQLDSRAEKTFERHFTAAELETFFHELITPYLVWFRKVRERQTQRDQSIQALDFPYDDYRPGQRDMAVAVYKAIRANDRLYVQAPTGVGKTIAALFPAVKGRGAGVG